MLLRILLELYWDVFEAVVYLQLRLEHYGFQISGSLVGSIILKGILLILLHRACVVPISDILLISQIEFIVVVSHVKCSQRLIKLLFIDA